MVRGEAQSAPGANDPGTLIVARDSKIRAIGTPKAPIVFTDLNDDNIGSDPGTPPYDDRSTSSTVVGQWGGVVLLGRSFVANNTGGRARSGPRGPDRGADRRRRQGSVRQLRGGHDRSALRRRRQRRDVLRLDPLRRLQPVGEQRDQRPDARRRRTLDADRPHRGLQHQGRLLRVVRRHGQHEVHRLRELRRRRRRLRRGLPRQDAVRVRDAGRAHGRGPGQGRRAGRRQRARRRPSPGPSRRSTTRPTSDSAAEGLHDAHRRGAATSTSTSATTRAGATTTASSATSAARRC